MNGELAHLVALALHGSAWLARPDAAPPDPENSTTRYIGRIWFTRPGPWPALPGSGAWLAWLADRGADHLSVVPAPDPVTDGLPPHVAGAYAGTRAWGLLASGDRPSLWVPTWRVGAPGAADNRIWHVRVAGAWHRTDAEPPGLNLEAATGALRQALISAGDFAHTHELEPWAGRFDEAIRQGGSADPEIPYHPDLAPPGTGLDVRRLLAMAATSWVFGGMGSWNDLGFPDAATHDRYDRVTERLYDAALGAFVAATT